MENQNQQSTRDLAATPVIPLPNPGEGGAVYPGNGSPSNPGIEDNTPVIPLPNPGEGGAVYPGPSGGTGNNRPSNGIQLLPGSTFPYTPRYAYVRFINASRGYPGFRIDIDGTRVVNMLNSATTSRYIRVSPGQHRITVSGPDGYIYLEKTFSFSSGSSSTVAIVNRPGGLNLTIVPDSCQSNCF